MKTFSKRLREAIEASKVTRYRLSQLTGISQGQLSRFVHGNAGLSLDAVDRVCDHLGLSIVGASAMAGKGE